MALGVVLFSIQHRELLWVAIRVSRYLGVNIRIDPVSKKWSIISKRMFMPGLQTRNYEDIAAIFKSKPETFKVTETKTPEGKFKSFTVETT